MIYKHYKFVHPLLKHTYKYIIVCEQMPNESVVPVPPTPPPPTPSVPSPAAELASPQLYVRRKLEELLRDFPSDGSSRNEKCQLVRQVLAQMCPQGGAQDVSRRLDFGEVVSTLIF